jgi:hypothetical protein
MNGAKRHLSLEAIVRAGAINKNAHVSISNSTAARVAVSVNAAAQI